MIKVKITVAKNWRGGRENKRIESIQTIDINNINELKPIRVFNSITVHIKQFRILIFTSAKISH